MSLGVSGKYRLDRRLGGGGMAEVFIGSTMGAEGFSRRIAIKRVLPGFSDNPGFAQMFVAEAQISSQLVHPNIVSVLDFDRDAESRLFLVMELVDGRDLDTLLSTGVLPLPVVIFVIGEVLRGLGFAHDLPTGTGMRGIVHRDVSPHNVLLSWEGAVKVSDFGIAKARAASEATASAFIKGKPAYMSPEQANGQRLDGRSDLFAVGVMLWEMMVGQRLFVAEDTRATLAAVLFGQIPRPRSVRPELPKDLERVTMKLLERDLPARYATAEEAIADLMNCADAPRSGREALIAVLAERFSADAPVRQSVARARSLGAQPTPVPGTLPEYVRPATGPHGAAGHPGGGPVGPVATTRPGLGTMMGARTGTLELPRRRWLTVVLAVIAAGAVGVIAFFAVSAARGKGAAPHDAGLGSVVASVGSSTATGGAGTPHDAAVMVTASDAAGGAASDLPHDASGSVAPEPAISVDAGVPAPLGDPGTTNAARPIPVPAHVAASDKRRGTLEVGGMPVVTVIVDGVNYGDSPKSIPLKVGKHMVEIKNAATGFDQVIPNVIINENRSTPLVRNNK